MSLNEPGSWLPEPSVRRATPEKVRRYRAFGAAAVWLTALADACMAGLFFTETDLSPAGALFATGMWSAVSGLVLLIAMALIWADLS